MQQNIARHQFQIFAIHIHYVMQYDIMKDCVTLLDK